MKTLGAKMKADGLVPIAFADKDGWPAMGTFDYLDMRINGYQFHMDLMAHKESWTDPKVKKVFDTWKETSSRCTRRDSLGRTWQEAAQSLVKKEAGLYLLGHVRRAAVPDADKPRTWTSSPSRRSTPPSAWTRSKRPSTASW